MSAQRPEREHGLSLFATLSHALAYPITHVTYQSKGGPDSTRDTTHSRLGRPKFHPGRKA